MSSPLLHSCRQITSFHRHKLLPTKCNTTFSNTAFHPLLRGMVATASFINHEVEATDWCSFEAFLDPHTLKMISLSKKGYLLSIHLNPPSATCALNVRPLYGANTKRDYPLFRKTVVDNGVGNYFPFCLRSFVPLERCKSDGLVTGCFKSKEHISLILISFCH